MAKSFNLTAQINLQGPANLKPIVNNLKKQLSGINTDVKININSQSIKTVDNITQKLRAMNAVLVQAKTNTDSLNASLSNLGSSLNTVAKNTSATVSGMSRTATSAQKASSAVKQVGTEMQEFGKQSALAIRRFAAFSVVSTAVYGLVRAVSTGTKAFIDFDKQLIKLQQVTGKGSVGILSLEKEITNLSTSLGVSSESLAGVATTLAQAGLSAQQTRIALAALAKTELAPSFDNITDSTEGAIAAMRQFGLEASELEGVLGSINAVSAAFAVEAKDIIAAIQRTGGVFAAASKGVSEGSDALNEFIAVFTSVRQTTRESAETIATGLRTIFTRIQRQSTVDALEALGIQLRDVDGQFVGAYEAVRRLSQGLSQLDPRSKEFAAISEELGGFRQIGKVIPLIQQFSVAQEALKVAQKGQSSLTDAQVIAQKSLANQIAKVREQFLALIREVGKSAVFQSLFKIVTGLASGLISLASAFKPILPILGIMGAIKGVSAIGQFATGFFGGLKKGGGASAVGSSAASAATGSTSRDQQNAMAQAATAIKDNTTSIQTLTTAINNLSNNVTNNSSVLNARTAKGLNQGGKVLGFAKGGVVPGSGNRDTVPAMLQPGEFVIRKNAVKSIGADKLHSMNKYAEGGTVEDRITNNLNAYDTKNKKQIKNFALAGLYAGSEKSGSFGVSGQKNIKLYKGTDKEEQATLYTSSLNTSLKGEGIEDLENTLKDGYLESVQEFTNSLANKLKAKPSKVDKSLDEQSFSVVAGNAFENAIRSLGAPYLEKTEKTKALDFPLGLGSAANLFGNIPSNIPADVTRTIGGKGKGEAAIVGQIERFLESLNNNEFTKAEYGGGFPLEVAKAISEIESAKITPAEIRKKLTEAKKNQDPKFNDVQKYLTEVGGTALKTGSLRTNYEKKAKNKPEVIDTVAQGLISLSEIIRGNAIGGSIKDNVPALLTPGEFVVNKKAAQAIGYSRLNKLNKADKIKGYNRGGIVGGIQTFLGGGRVDQDAVRAQGTVLKNIKEAEKTFAMVMGSVTKEVRDSILKTFKGIEQVGAGGKTSLGTKFTANTRGQAAFGTQRGEQVSLMGLQIGGKKAQATTETVSHEAGHLADAAMTNFKGFSSQTAGTFQFDIVEKIKPTMEAAFKKAGYNANMIANYLTKNEELFAEFFAKASPEIKNILTSTTDSAKGMEALKKHLEKAGETYAGLSSADIILSGGSKPPTPPGGGPPKPPLPTPRPPTGPGNTRDRFNFADENDKEFFAYRAKQAGQSVGSYRVDAAKKIAAEQKNIFENQKGRREETRRSFQGQAGTTGKELRTLGRASQRSGTPEDKKKFEDKYKEALKDAAIKIKDIAPSLNASDLKAASKQLVDAMIKGTSINDAISESGSALNKAFNANITTAEALEKAIEKTAKDLEISADQLKGNLSRKDIARQQFIASETGQKFGRAAQYAPDAVRTFSGTGAGQATMKAADFLSGKGLTGKLEKTLGGAGKFIGDKIQALGGPMVVLGGTIAMAADQIQKAFDIKDPTTAGVVGGIGGAGSGLASGAVLGAQIAGPVGAMIGGITGAIVGGIDGAFKAFNQARLAKNLKNLEDSAHKASIALKEFETQQTQERAEALIAETMSGQDAIRDLSQQAQVQYGERSFSRAISDALGQIPVISSIMGVAERGEATKALDQRAAMVMGNFSRVGDRQRSMAPNEQIEAVMNRAKQAEEEAGDDPTARANARREVFAQANQTYQQMARQGYSDDDIYGSMGRQTLLQQGRSEADISKMNRQDIIDAGKAAAGAAEEAAIKQQHLSNVMRETNRSVESLLDVFRIATAGLDRFNYELGLIAIKAEESAGALSGKAQIGQVDRSNEQVLGNISGYSKDEVKAVASNIGALVGGEGGKQLENQVVAAKVLQDELPKILRNASSEGIGGAGGVIGELKNVFEGLSIDAPPGLFDAVEKSLEEKIGGRQGVPLSELADDLDFLGSASKVSAASLELARKYAEAFANVMQQASDYGNKFGDALNKATELQLKAADIRARAEIQLAEALGKNLSLAEQSAPFENRIRGLTDGVITGGSVDPNVIFEKMQEAISDLPQMQSDLAEKQRISQANPENEEAKKAVVDQIELMSRQNNKINQANQALEELANDSSKAASALNKLNDLNKVAAASVNFLRKALTSDSKELMTMGRQLKDYTKLISGKANAGDVNNLQFRQNAFAGLDLVSTMMPESLGKQLEAKMTRAMLEATPQGQAMLQQTTGAIGPDDKEYTFDQTLRMMEGGIDPAQQQYIDAYKDATERQALAADRLAESALLVAETFSEAINNTVATIATLPETMKTAQNQATNEPTKDAQEAKDATVELVWSKDKIEEARAALFGNLPTLGFDAATAGTIDTSLKEAVTGMAALASAIILLYKAYMTVGGIKGLGQLLGRGGGAAGAGRNPFSGMSGSMGRAAGRGATVAADIATKPSWWQYAGTGASQLTSPLSGGAGVFGANVGGGAAGAGLAGATAIGAAYGGYAALDWANSLLDLTVDFDGKMEQVRERAKNQYNKNYTDQVVENLKQPGDALIQFGDSMYDLLGSATEYVGKKIGLLQDKTKALEQKLKQSETSRSEAAGIDTSAYNALGTTEQNQVRGMANQILQQEKLKERLSARSKEKGSDAYVTDLTKEDLQYVTGRQEFNNPETLLQDQYRVYSETMNSNTKVKPEYQQALDQVLARGRAEAKVREVEDAAAAAIADQKPAMDAVETMANKASEKGSIYTHDIHTEGLLKEFLGKKMDSESGNIEKTIPADKTLTKFLPGVEQKLKELGESSTKFFEDAFKGMGINSEGILKALSEAPAKLKDLGNGIFELSQTAMTNVGDKLSPESNESCECKVLKEILAVLQSNNGVVATTNKLLDPSVSTQAKAEVDLSKAREEEKQSSNNIVTKPAVIQAPPAPGANIGSKTKSVVEMLSTGGISSMKLPSGDSLAKKNADLASKRNAYSIAGGQLSRNEISKEEYQAKKEAYKESRGRYGFASTAQSNPYQQQQNSRRQEYLATKRPEIAEALMTKEEKLEKQKQQQREKEAQQRQNQPVPSSLPTIRSGSLDGGAAGDRSAIGSGPNGQSLSTIITVDKSATDLLEGLRSTFGNFNAYIDKLATVAATIPSEINLVGNYDLNINITGAAAFENLSKEMKNVAEAIIRPKLEQLRDEISQATKGAVKSSASTGYRGDVNTTSTQGLS
jgi:TP901 family phage tail tape measure protein